MEIYIIILIVLCLLSASCPHRSMLRLRQITKTYNKTNIKDSSSVIKLRKKVKTTSFPKLNKKSKLCFCVSFLLLLVVGGFRDITVGTDTQNYADYFNGYGIEVFDMYHISEPIYLLIQYIVARIGLHYESLVFLYMFVTLSALFYFAMKISTKPIVVILCYYLLYFYFYSFNTIRQALAMVFVLFAIYYLERDNKKNFFIFSLIAMLSHTTAIISFVVLLIKRIKLSNRAFAFCTLATFVIGITPIVKFAVSSFFSFLPGYLYSYIVDYDSRELGFSLSRCMLTLYCFALLRLSKRSSLYIKVFAFGICLLNLFAFQPIAARIAQFFTISQIAIIPNLYNLIKKRKYYYPLKWASYAYMFILFVYLLSGNVGEVCPYVWGGIKF